MQCKPDEPDYKKVRRIVNIKEPFHTLPLATLSIVLSQNRNRQERKHLKHTV